MGGNRLFWRRGINLTDKQEQDIIELDNSFASAGMSGFADSLAWVIGVDLNRAADIAQLALGASAIAEMDSAEAFERILSALTTAKKKSTITAT